MRAGQGGQIVAAVIINDDLLPVSLLQHLLPFFGSGQVGKTGFALLQSLAIEAIATIHIYCPLDMTHVVGDKGSAIE